MFPDAQSLSYLLKNLTDFFARQWCVCELFVFGSLATGLWDRWSDIDMLVVTQARQDYGLLFASLCRFKPVCYHGLFVPEVEPAGGHILGIVFTNEAVFHHLDLNFMSLADYQAPGSIDRFARMKSLYATPQRQPTLTEPLKSPIIEAESEWQKTLDLTIHWTKKAVKRYLRGNGEIEVVREYAARLADHLNNRSSEIELLRGDIQWVGKQYLAIAEKLLEQGEQGNDNQ